MHTDCSELTRPRPDGELQARQVRTPIRPTAQRAVPVWRPPALGLVLLALLWTGCGEEAGLVARVGDLELSQQDFAAFVERLSPGLRSDKQGRAADRDHLQSMIDQELLFLEASATGIDTSAAVVQQLLEMGRQRLVERYRNEVILRQVSITSDDIDRAFVDLGYNRERLFSRILVRTREELADVGRRLSAGDAFEEIAAEFAANDLFARQGDGVVSWIGRKQAERRFAISPDLYTDLPTGRIAEPVRLAGGWQIFRFVEDREAQLAGYLEDVQERLLVERTREVKQAEFERLRHRYNVTLDPEGLEALVAAIRDQGETDMSRQLYRFEGGEVTVAEGLAGLKIMGASGMLADAEGDEIAELVVGLLLPVRLFEAEARKRGWMDDEAFLEWHENERRKLIIGEVFEAATVGTAPTRDEVEAYYEISKSRYRTQEEVFVHELWTADEERAATLRSEWEGGAEIADLLDRQGVRSHVGIGGHGLRDHGYEMRLVRLYEPRYPELIAAAFAAAEGDLVGPIESLSGYAVFRVLRRAGGEIEPLEKARSRVEASLRARRENEAIGTFIRKLQDKYADQVTVLVDWD